MDVKAKVVITSKADVYDAYNKGKRSTVRMNPVMGGSEENKTWAKYTPGGSIELTIDNPAAVDAFELGAEYIVTFTKVAPITVKEVTAAVA